MNTNSPTRRRARVVTAAALATVALTVGVATALPSHQPPPPVAAAGVQVTDTAYFVSGTIKPNGTGGWYVLDDAAHTPEGGLTVTSVTSTAINVSFTEGTEIYTFVVGPDETLAALGWTAGASVGLDTAVIYLGKAGVGQINPTQVSNTSANLWIIARLAPVGGAAPNQVCVPQ